MTTTTVIVGASLAGINAARTLRLQGQLGPIVVVDADPERPYDRPPLSKQILTGEWEREKILLPAGKEDLNLDFRLGTRAKALDLSSRQIILEGPTGAVETSPFDSLVIASGASARRLPDTAGIAGVHVVRTLADSRLGQAILGNNGLTASYLSEEERSMLRRLLEKTEFG